MIKNAIRIWSITLAVMFGFMVLSPVTVVAQDAKNEICKGANAPNCNPPSGSTTVERLIRVVVNLLSFVVGVAAVIMLIIGGLKYITSSGDSSGINSAKNTILYAIVGIIVAAFAQGLVRLVLNRL